jgi:hypothetical protein
VAAAAEAVAMKQAAMTDKVFKRAQRHVKYVRIPCYPKQLAAIFDCKDHYGNPARYAMIEASTKAGKTRGCIAWLAEQAILHGREGRNYWWVAPVYAQAEIAYRRFKRGISRWFVAKTNDGDLKITLLNGATLWFKTGEKPDNLFGEDVYAAVIDEASRVRAEAFHAIRSTLTFTGGPVRCIGNVKGRKNWFYEMSRKAQHGEPGYSYAKLTAYDAVEGGVFPLSEVEDAQRTLPEHVFRELYLAEPSDDGGNPFGLSHIQNCIAPMSDNDPFACGGDFAKSVDWNVAIALDKGGATCGFERWQSPWEITIPRMQAFIEQTPALVDETGVGSPVVERLQGVNPRVEGYIFTAQTKQALMTGLAVAIQNRHVTFPAGVIVDELECFEYEYTRTGVKYTAPVGYHDDCVMALALAVEQRRRLNPHVAAGGPGGPVRASPWLEGEGDDDDGAVKVPQRESTSVDQLLNF